LRELASSLELDGPAPAQNERERNLLARYVEHFNAHDFEEVRAMLTEEVRLDLISRAQKQGIAELSKDYFANYSQLDDWHFTMGLIEDRLAILVNDPHLGSAQPAYFILISWEDNKVALIRDYRYVRYVMQDVEISTV
jgi:RNA polymerase sigma-70 factor (ECF subfamily)